MLVSGVWQSDSVIHIHVSILWMALAAENPPANEGDLRDTGSILGREDLLEEDTATHSSILAWKIPRTEDPGGLQSKRSQRVGHD